MARAKEDVLRYLADLRGHYAAYHNHKETSAWAGVALYVLFETQVAFARDELFKVQAVVAAAWFLNIVFFLIVLIYLRAQFRLRRAAANYVAAIQYFSVDLLPKTDEDLEKLDWSVAPNPDLSHSSLQTLPRFLLCKALEMDFVGHLRMTLEATAYAIVVVSFVSGVGRLWLR